MFAAEPPQEPLPYGRWAEALGEHFLEAVGRDRDRGDAGRARRDHLVPRPHLGRPHLRARHVRHRRGLRAVRLRVYTREHEGAQAEAFEAVVDYTDETADANPEWTLDLSDQEIGHWRGPEGRRGGVTLVWGVALVANGAVATTELGPTTTDQCSCVDDRFTLSRSTPTRATTWRCASSRTGRGAGQGVAVRGR